MTLSKLGTDTHDTRASMGEVVKVKSAPKNITGFPFWNDFLKSLNITNYVTDMQPIYIYTPLVKQAMSLRKLINVLCLTVL